jgi:hypothetical protein
VYGAQVMAQRGPNDTIVARALTRDHTPDDPKVPAETPVPFQGADENLSETPIEFCKEPIDEPLPGGGSEQERERIEGSGGVVARLEGDAAFRIFDRDWWVSVSTETPVGQDALEHAQREQ